jgi:signal peptidase I
MTGRTLLRLAGGLVLLVGGWLLLAPPALGGQLAYAVTSGTSMKPSFSTGDLAILRAGHSAEVGQVAAYHSHVLGRVVMHRVIGIHDGLYVFKGDNNGYTDPDRPTAEDLIGTLALRVPGAGTWFERLTGRPAVVLAVLLIIGVPAGAAAHRRKQRRRTVSRHAAPRPSRTSPLAGAPGILRAGFASCLIGFLAAVALGGAAWAAPTSSGGDGQVDRTPGRLTFSYSAAVPPSPVYAGERVVSPDPIFRALTDVVDVRVSYQAQARETTGRYRLEAMLTDASGWHATIPLVKDTDFESGQFVASSRLRLDQLQGRAEAAAAVAKVPMHQLTVVVQSTVLVEGQAAFAPRLRFSLTPTQLRLIDPPSAMSVGHDTPSNVRAIPGPRRLEVGRFSIAADTALSLALPLAGVSLVGSLIALLALRRSAPSSEADAIRRRYAPLLIQVHPMPVPAGRPVVDVTQFSTLAKLAERYGLLVLHWCRSGVETFVVQDEGITYRYRASTSTSSEALTVTSPDSISRPVVAGHQ